MRLVETLWALPGCHLLKSRTTWKLTRPEDLGWIRRVSPDNRRIRSRYGRGPRGRGTGTEDQRLTNQNVTYFIHHFYFKKNSNYDVVLRIRDGKKIQIQDPGSGLNISDLIYVLQFLVTNTRYLNSFMFYVFPDPRSSSIREPTWKKSDPEYWIRDKHPRSATLLRQIFSYRIRAVRFKMQPITGNGMCAKKTGRKYPYHGITHPDPALSFSSLQDANKKKFFAYKLLFTVTKLRSHKTV